MYFTWRSHVAKAKCVLHLNVQIAQHILHLNVSIPAIKSMLETDEIHV